MKNLFCALFLLSAVSVSAAECRKHNHAYVAPTERGEPFLLKNRLTSYVITFRYTNPSSTKPAFVLPGMPAPVNKTGYSRRDFTSVTVNGIDSRLLEPKKYEIFNTDKGSGVDVHYNFNGIPMIQRFSVSDSSPLLEMSWRCGNAAESGIQTISIRFTVMPCAAGQTPASYSREIVSPTGKYASASAARWKKYALKKSDFWLILQDGKYQGGNGSAYNAPVLLCPDWTGIRSGTARFGTHQDMYLDFLLDPKVHVWKFGLLESEVGRSNQDFAEFLKNQKVIR